MALYYQFLLSGTTATMVILLLYCDGTYWHCSADYRFPKPPFSQPPTRGRKCSIAASIVGGNICVHADVVKLRTSIFFNSSRNITAWSIRR